MDARDLQRLFKAHIRQNGGNAAREQRLTRARRPNEQHIVPARGGNFQRAFGSLLALDVHEIRARRALGHELIVGNRNQRLNGTLAGKMRHHLSRFPAGRMAIPSTQRTSMAFACGSTMALSPSARAASTIGSTPRTG